MVRHASREQFATWHDMAQTAQPCRLDRLRDTEMARHIAGTKILLVWGLLNISGS